MRPRPRIYYSDSQKALIWERWSAGWTLHEIEKLLDRGHSSIHRIIAESGGIRPPDRSRSRRAPTLAEREEISLGLSVGQSMRSIAKRLGRSPSTISREIGRNGDQDGYRATLADQAAWERALRPKLCKLAKNRALAGIVADMLRRLWSPEQIAGWLQHTYPNDQNLHESHETIYRSLFIQAQAP
jgi:Helix-turn-helix domain